METRPFGATGWRLFPLALGTVELGLDYGIHRPGETRPSGDEAQALLLAAFEHGIELLDTAPGYGDSEAVVGRALARWQGELRIATKVEVPAGAAGRERREAVTRSLDRSRSRLGRDRLDLVQVHNATVEDLADPWLFEALLEGRERGVLDRLGASVYGTEAAEAALRHPELAAVQLAYSLLDRRMAERVLPLAAARGVGVLLRSIYLKGALTDRRDHLPPRLGALRAAAEGAAAWAARHRLGLAEGALRFALSAPAGIALVGLSGRAELAAALAAVAAGPLPEAALAECAALATADPAVVDPRNWGMP